MSRRGVLVALVALVAIQAALLYISASSILAPTTDSGSVGAYVAIGLATFIVAPGIGVAARTWQGAIVFAALAWWAAVLAHAGHLLRPAPGVPAGYVPYWLIPNLILDLLASLALFAALAWLGWLAGGGAPRRAGATHDSGATIGRPPPREPACHPPVWDTREHPHAPLTRAPPSYATLGSACFSV